MAKTLEELNDEGLMELILEQDHRAFSVLVTRRHQMFYAAAYRMLVNCEEAEDIVQDGFLKIWQKPQIWRAGKGAKFTTWFYKVIMNLCLDRLKKSKIIHVEMNEKLIAGGLSQDRELQLNEQEKALEDAIKSLPIKQKTALNLCVYEEISNKEAANIMGVSVKALESLLMRAKAGVRDYLLRQGILEQGEIA